MTGSKNSPLIAPFLFASLLAGALFIHGLFISYGTGVIVASPETQEGAWCAAIFDSLGKNLTQGRADVDPRVAGTEAFYVNGKEYVYYGPFPAFLRVPLNKLFPAFYGYWCRFACLLADGILLTFFALLVETRLRANPRLSPNQKIALFCLSFLAFAIGSPLVFLMSAAYVFHETVLWGYAWSVGALYFLFRWLEAEKPERAAAAAGGVALCAAAAFLSRVTFGVPWFLVIGAMALRLCVRRPAGFKRQLFFALVPVLATLALQAWYNDARFGSVLKFADRNAYDLDNVDFHRFFQYTGDMDWRRIPFGFFNYFAKPGKYFSADFPWVHLDWVAMHPVLHVPNYKEWLIPIPLVAPWLVIGAIWGAVCLRARNGAMTRMLVPAGLFSQWIILLSYFTMTHRYAPEFFPLLLYLYAFFLSDCRSFRRPRIRAFAAICAFSLAMNAFSTLSWLAEFNFDTPARHREALWKLFKWKIPDPEPPAGNQPVQKL